MEKESGKLSYSELLKQIDELRKLQEILISGKCNFQTPELISEYKKIKGKNIVSIKDIEKGEYYFSEMLFSRNPDNFGKIDKVGPTLLLCKGFSFEKENVGEGIFGRTKYREYRRANFAKIWETHTTINVGYGYNKGSNMDFSIYKDIFCRELATEETYHKRVDPKFQCYDTVDLFYSANKKTADAFYQKYIINQKKEIDKQAEQYRKFIYVTLRLMDLEEKLANKNKNQAFSSINIDENEFVALQKKYMIK